VSPDGVLHSSNFMNELLQSNEKHQNLEAIQNYTAGFRGFNIACIVAFLLSLGFMALYFGSLESAQIVFYDYYVVFAIYNIAFYTLGPLQRQNLVRARKLTVYLPFGLLVLLQAISLVLILSVLDGLNLVNNNIYPPPTKDLEIT